MEIYLCCNIFYSVNFNHQTFILGFQLFRLLNLNLCYFWPRVMYCITVIRICKWFQAFVHMWNNYNAYIRPTYPMLNVCTEKCAFKSCCSFHICFLAGAVQQATYRFLYGGFQSCKVFHTFLSKQYKHQTISNGLLTILLLI